MTSVKEKFIADLIKELNNVNSHQLSYEGKRLIDVSFVVSVIDQNIDQCKEFIDDITVHTYDINGYDEDRTGGYTNGRIRILIEKPEEEKESEFMFDAYYNYCYFIEFNIDERNWGYCECKSSEEGYIDEIGCCGNGCDWSAPSFSLTKEITIGGARWNGYQSDYWNYKKQFLNNEKNKNEEVEKQRKIEEITLLEEQLAVLQDKLNDLKAK